MLPIVVLAGGLATRLRPVTEKVPKSLIPVNNVPFVLHQLALFEKYGFKHVHYCLGFLGEMVEKEIRNSGYINKMQITFSYDGAILLGTGGAIKKMLDSLTDYFFITYGDSYLDCEYGEIEARFNEGKKNEKTGLMTVFSNKDKWDTSNVIFDGKNIKLYSKKNKTSDMHYIDYGVGILSKNNFADNAEETNFDLSDIYESLSKDNNLIGFEVGTRFYEIGSFSGIEDISIYLKKNNEHLYTSTSR